MDPGSARVPALAGAAPSWLVWWALLFSVVLALINMVLFSLVGVET